MRFLEKKIPPPIAAITSALLMASMTGTFPPIEINDSLRITVTVSIFLIGLCFDISALTSFKKAQTSINPIKPEKATLLVTTGIYCYTRNPMYMGLVCFLTAWACYLASPTTLVCVAGFMLYIYVFQIRPEERILTELFGDEYLEYKAQVRPWL